MEKLVLVIKQGEALKRGSKDPRVKIIQQMFGFKDPNNSFGPLTEKAVIKFQKDSGLQTDGIVGPLTATALQATYDALVAKQTQAALATGVTDAKPTTIPPGFEGLKPGDPPKEDEAEAQAGMDNLEGKDRLDTKTMIAVGLGVASVAIIGLALWLGRKPKNVPQLQVQE